MRTILFLPNFTFLLKKEMSEIAYYKDFNRVSFKNLCSVPPHGATTAQIQLKVNLVETAKMKLYKIQLHNFRFKLLLRI